MANSIKLNKWIGEIFALNFIGFTWILCIFHFFFVSRLKGRYAIVWRKTPPKMMMGKKKRWGGRGHMTWPSPDEKHVFCGPLHVKWKLILALKQKDLTFNPWL